VVGFSIGAGWNGNTGILDGETKRIIDMIVEMLNVNNVA